jgi:hypothetical protein
LYKEGLISMDEILTNFTNLVNSEYDLIASEVSVRVAAANISINNKLNQ